MKVFRLCFILLIALIFPTSSQAQLAAYTLDGDASDVTGNALDGSPNGVYSFETEGGRTYLRLPQNEGNLVLPLALSQQLADKPRFEIRFDFQLKPGGTYRPLVKLGAACSQWVYNCPGIAVGFHDNLNDPNRQQILVTFNDGLEGQIPDHPANRFDSNGRWLTIVDTDTWYTLSYIVDFAAGTFTLNVGDASVEGVMDENSTYDYDLATMLNQVSSNPIIFGGSKPTPDQDNQQELWLDNIALFAPPLELVGAISPDQKVVSMTEPVTFVWPSSPSAASYDFELASASGFGSPLYSANVTDTTYVISDALEIGDHAWRVRIRTALATGSWSQGAFSYGFRDPEFSFDGLTGHMVAWVDGAPNDLSLSKSWGFSMYSAVHNIKPGLPRDTQVGWGTWLVPNQDENGNGDPDPFPRNEYGMPLSVCDGRGIPGTFQSNEGGIGNWGGLGFPTEKPLFLVAATANCYQSGIGGPAYRPGGRDLLPAEDLFFAQLSNRLLMPPSPMVLEIPTSPSALGYGWIALPIIPEDTSPYGIPTGPNTWTLFFSATNFRGPIGFFTPAFWNSVDRDQSPWQSVGYGFDSRNGVASVVAMEVGFTPGWFTTDGEGGSWAKIPALSLTTDSNNRASIIQDVKHYTKSAIWDGFASWMDGGQVPTEFEGAGIQHSRLTSTEGGVHMDDGTPYIDYGGSFKHTIFETDGGQTALGFEWDGSLGVGVIPQFYHKTNGSWHPVAVTDVPAGAGLRDLEFETMQPLTIPAVDIGPESPFAPSGWAAGPFSTNIGDGSTVDYVWYRFVDQPAIKRLNMTEDQRNRLQAWVESVHDQGTHMVSMPLPSSGELATFDNGQLVTPPAGMERGYVPIAIAQYPNLVNASVPRPVELPEAVEMDVFPNPFHGQARVNFQTRTPQSARIEVFDMLGRRVMQEGLDQLERSHSVLIDGARWSAGVYVIRMTASDGSSASKKVVLLNN